LVLAQPVHHPVRDNPGVLIKQRYGTLQRIVSDERVGIGEDERLAGTAFERLRNCSTL
jgi:hypothetical protein